MEDQELKERLEILEKKIDAVYVSAEKTRKYLLALLIGSVALIVLPLILFMFAIPSFISTYGQLGDLLQ